jgi:hypothetical protein
MSTSLINCILFFDFNKALSNERDQMSEEMKKMMSTVRALEEEKATKGSLTLTEETELKAQVS